MEEEEGLVLVGELEVRETDEVGDWYRWEKNCWWN